MADSFSHFILECKNAELTAIRQETGIKAFAVQLAKEVSRQQTGSSSSKNNNSNKNTLHVQDVRVTRSATTHNNDKLAKLLLGGRVSMQNTGSTAAAPTSPETSVFDLQNWQQVKGNNDHTKLQETIDKILKGTDAKRRKKKTKKKKKIQMEQPLFEASTVILAQYLQAGMVVRTKILWDLSASSQRSNVGQS